jgi:hypothetical protein
MYRESLPGLCKVSHRSTFPALTILQAALTILKFHRSSPIFALAPGGNRIGWPGTLIRD